MVGSGRFRLASLLGAVGAEACIRASAPATRDLIPGRASGSQFPSYGALAVPWNGVRVPAPWSRLDMVRTAQSTINQLTCRSPASLADIDTSDLDLVA